jgi:1,4-alpha-glucan branching enzyme
MANQGFSLGGAGFGAQWDSNFVHPIRAAVIGADDRYRSMSAVRDALCFSYNGDPFERVVYSESHDEVANGKARVPSEINPGDPHHYYAQKRSTLAAGLVFTAPGIPMLFQGQEFLEGGWFRDTVPLDWHLKDDFQGETVLDLIRAACYPAFRNSSAALTDQTYMHRQVGRTHVRPSAFASGVHPKQSLATHHLVCFGSAVDRARTVSLVLCAQDPELSSEDLGRHCVAQPSQGCRILEATRQPVAT